jgi:hypothetical protein
MLADLTTHIRSVRASDWETLRLDDLWLDSLFCSVRLSDGSVGLALNYDQEGLEGVPREVSAATREYLLETRQQDPLLWDLLTQPSDSLAQTALLLALLSALSAPVLASPERLAELGLQSQEGRISLRTFPGKTVTIVGAGGYLGEAVQHFERVYCCDFNHADADFAGKVRRRFPQENLVLDDGQRTLELIAEADIVCLSASTLCNGSLAALLPQDPKVVILEGPSGGVLPGPLFARGVTHLVHNPVDVDFVHLSQRFSRQQAKGLTDIVSGRFIDILLPEQRTVYPA